MASNALLKSCASTRRCATFSCNFAFGETVRLGGIDFPCRRKSQPGDELCENRESRNLFDTQFPPCKNRGRGIFLQGGLGRRTTQSLAEVAELADAHGSGPCTRKGVGVRVPSSAPVVPPGIVRGFLKLHTFGNITAMLSSVAERMPPITAIPSPIAALACAQTNLLCADCKCVVNFRSGIYTAQALAYGARA